MFLNFFFKFFHFAYLQGEKKKKIPGKQNSDSIDYPDHHHRPDEEEDGTVTESSPSTKKDESVEPMENKVENDINEEVDERKVLAKIDLRLLPITTAIYVMAFLDR